MASKVIPISPIHRLKQLNELGLCNSHDIAVSYSAQHDMFRCVLRPNSSGPIIGYGRTMLRACEVAAIQKLVASDATFDWRTSRLSEDTFVLPLPYPDNYMGGVPDRHITNPEKCLMGLQRSGLLKFDAAPMANGAYKIVLRIGACKFNFTGRLETAQVAAAEFAINFCNADAKQMEALSEDVSPKSASPVVSVVETPIVEPPKTQQERVFEALVTGIRAMPGFPSEVENVIVTLRAMLKDGCLNYDCAYSMLRHTSGCAIEGYWSVVSIDTITPSGWTNTVIRKTLEEVVVPPTVNPASSMTKFCPADCCLIGEPCIGSTYSTRKAVIKEVPSSSAESTNKSQLASVPSILVEPKVVVTSNAPSSTIVHHGTTGLTAAWPKLINFRIALNEPMAYINGLIGKGVIKSVLQKAAWFDENVGSLEITFPDGGQSVSFEYASGVQNGLKAAALALFNLFG